jgi:hypothetical protein
VQNIERQNKKGLSKMTNKFKGQKAKDVLCKKLQSLRKGL